MTATTGPTQAADDRPANADLSLALLRASNLVDKLDVPVWNAEAGDDGTVLLDCLDLADAERLAQTLELTRATSVPVVGTARWQGEIVRHHRPLHVTVRGYGDVEGHRTHPLLTLVRILAAVAIAVVAGIGLGTTGGWLSALAVVAAYLSTPGQVAVNDLGRRIFRRGGAR